jgi:microcystin degradation protein MlrC
MRGLYASAKQIADREGVVSHSIVLGFPYADVPEMGSSVLVVTDADAELAQFLADQMACEMDRRKSAFEPEFLSIEDAVRNANIASAYPIVLLDMGDNVGGGSPANSAGNAREWIEHGEGRAFVVLCDPEAVQLADKSGVDAEILTVVGDPQNPIKGTFRVQSLHDGVFHEEKPRHGGFLEFDQGRTAVLETADGRLTIMATTRRMAPYSLSQLTSFGINPSAFQMIIAKGVIAPMAAYEPIAKGGFLHVDSPGVTRANMRKLDYLHRRRPLFPFE